MGILQFELTDQHIKLLRHLRWGKRDSIIVAIDDEEFSAPFGENSLYEGIDLILNGKPSEFNPMETDELPEYTKEQKEAWDLLYSQLPTALEIILQTQSFETGTYRCKFHLRNWVKYK